MSKCGKAGCKEEPLAAEEEKQALTFDYIFLPMMTHDIEQDKVNYAVSEGEDRVTGATMLTRMAGCNGMYWAATVLC